MKRKRISTRYFIENKSSEYLLIELFTRKEVNSKVYISKEKKYSLKKPTANCYTLLKLVTFISSLLRPPRVFYRELSDSIVPI